MSQSDTEARVRGRAGAPAPGLATTRASPLKDHGQDRGPATIPARTGERTVPASPWTQKLVGLLHAVSFQAYFNLF